MNVFTDIIPLLILNRCGDLKYKTVQDNMSKKKKKKGIYEALVYTVHVDGTTVTVNGTGGILFSRSATIIMFYTMLAHPLPPWLYINILLIYNLFSPCIIFSTQLQLSSLPLLSIRRSPCKGIEIEEGKIKTNNILYRMVLCTINIFIIMVILLN